MCNRIQAPSGEGNDPEVPFAAGVSVFAIGMPKQIGGPYAPKGSRPRIVALCVAESTSLIDPGVKPHGPAVHRYFTVAKGGCPSLGNGDQLA